MKNILLSIFNLVVFFSPLLSQDEVLLTIENQPLFRSEFERIYNKNSNIEGYENKPAAEYLDMFINFKLKVLEAKKLGYDTTSLFINELAGYREQLSKPYLQDRKLIDQLVREAYDRTIKEVNASHIMVQLSASPSPSDTFAAFNKALSIRNRIIAGESFEKLASELSDDPSGKANGGKLGWFSAFTMVYPFENAAYQTPEGQCSLPVRSKYGYHIIKVNGYRDALGELKLAHIMVRADQNETTGDKVRNQEKIEACYKSLQGGATFEDMVKQYSEDPASSKNKGQMRWLRSGELPPEIEEKVFVLKDSGTYTSPIQSPYGWHIFQLQGKRQIPDFEKIKSQLEEKVFMDERGKRTEQSFNTYLKKEYGYVSYPENIELLVPFLDSSLYAGNWVPPGELIDPVFTINNRDYSQKELADFIVKSKRYNKRESLTSIVHRKLDDLVNMELRNLEKSQLEKKYPAFRYLMEEYHDGILLFNIMDDKVWSKASGDSAALMDFYRAHQPDYIWKERADVSMYSLKNTALEKTAVKLARKRITAGWPAAEYVRQLCNDTLICVEVTDQKIEKDEPKPLGGFEWKKGSVKKIKQGNDLIILVVNKILPPAQKSFEETQGQVTADYQNFLDKQWIDSLRAKYTVTVDYDVLKLVK
jgi:peptidyl-prolyl cis-trans isomerase SurA